MSTAIWGESETQSDENYPLSLLKSLLLQMMEQFMTQGACLALYDENIRQMVIRLHNRAQSTSPHPAHVDIENIETIPMNRRRSSGIAASSTSSTTGRMRRLSRSLPALEQTAISSRDLFPLGEAYTFGQDLIGAAWRKNDLIMVSYDEYIATYAQSGVAPHSEGGTPTYLLAIPIPEPLMLSDPNTSNHSQQILGVIILYQVAPSPGFQHRQNNDAWQWAERFGLYIQNQRLRRLHTRNNDYMKGLQQISTAFPSDVILSKLVEQVYQFVMLVVPVSSMLLTLYDRDTKKIYDVFAIDHGTRIEGLYERPVIARPEERPLWWKVTQEQQRTVLLSPAQDEPELIRQYGELLKGSWRDQSGEERFLLLPMKMFTRVVGSLSLASPRPDAFSPENILVLETMVQLITVSIENAKLYDRSRRSVAKARQREESLAAMNSALQAISSVLNLGELLHKFVETAAKLVQAGLCTFFQLTGDGEELIAQAIFDSTGKWNDATQASSRAQHDDLIKMIRLPFQNSILCKLVEADSFFYLDTALIDELALISPEGGSIFLRETHSHKMLMIPVRYQSELVGILAVHTPWQDRVFRPEEVSTLLAISGQAASAIRNAQLFEEIRDANAELQRMDKLKDEFIVTASHELRTPLSAISGYASMLKRQSARIDSQQALRYATKISGATQQLTDLIGQMTEAAKVGSIDKKLELQSGPVQLLTAAEIATTMLSVNIEQTITVQIEPDLWVQCDALHLRQIITNLLDNAAKYSPPAGQIVISASATTLSQLPEDQVDYSKIVHGEDAPVALVRVRDEGEGIPLEDQEKIFEKFVRAARSLTTPVRGSGLGLFICRRYIEAMGGKLWLEMSIPGEGSVFSFYLPRIEAPIKTGERHESERQNA
ncbi:MAG TPA: ATP-binding protein [Ktedonobacteraceae bacterium]|nr:ATP-binding protein [Ktedonobacteraceae bacterium]